MQHNVGENIVEWNSGVAWRWPDAVFPWAYWFMYFVNLGEFFRNMYFYLMPFLSFLFLFFEFL